MGKKNTPFLWEGAKMKDLCISPVDCHKVIQKVETVLSSETLVTAQPGVGTQEAVKRLFTIMTDQLEQMFTNILSSSLKWVMSDTH